jgi:hypothetical protein
MLKRLGVAVAGRKALLVDVALQDALVPVGPQPRRDRLVASNRVTARDVMDTRRVVLTQAALEKLQSVLGLARKGSANEADRSHSAGRSSREDHGPPRGRPYLWSSTWRAEANKLDIKRAVESLLGSKVESVRTALAHGKVKRQGKYSGRRSDWKKAYVRLRDGERPAGVPAGRVSRSRIRQSCPFASTNRHRRVSGSRPFRPSTRSRPSTPYRPLTEILKQSGGRNNHGELTSWWRGGGHKRLYRVIDFKRDKKDIPAKVSTVEYDPNRSSRIALLTYADGEKRYILQPSGVKVGDTLVSGDHVGHPAGQLPAAEEHPAGHADPQRGAAAGQGRPDRAQRRIVRAAGGA